MRDLLLNIITPMQHHIKDLAIKSITVNTINGQITILKNHINLISSLTMDKCIITLPNNNKQHVNINYGILIVKPNEVKILTNDACNIDSNGIRS